MGDLPKPGPTSGTSVLVKAKTGWCSGLYFRKEASEGPPEGSRSHYEETATWPGHHWYLQPDGVHIIFTNEYGWEFRSSKGSIISGRPHGSYGYYQLPMEASQGYCPVHGTWLDVCREASCEKWGPKGKPLDIDPAAVSTWYTKGLKFGKCRVHCPTGWDPDKGADFPKCCGSWVPDHGSFEMARTLDVKLVNLS